MHNGPTQRAINVNIAMVLVLIVIAAGCGTIRNTLSYITITTPIWMPDGWVYYLREVDSEGSELWRQHTRGDANEKMLLSKDASVSCPGPFAFLFRAPSDGLGIATDCGSTGTTLTSYSPARKQFRHIASTPEVSNAVFGPDGSIGYVEMLTECGGVVIRPITNGTIGRFPAPITVAGRTWRLDGGNDCHHAADTQPAVLAPSGTLYFMAAPDSIGKLPVTDPDQYTWYLCSWQSPSTTPTVLAALPGLADLAISSDGQFLIAATATEKTGSVTMINTTTGSQVEVVTGVPAYSPSIAPDGTGFVYTENRHRLRFETLPKKP